MPELAPPSIYMAQFKEKVEKYSNGEILITRLGPEAIPPADAAAYVERGAVEMATVGGAYFEPFVPGITSANLAE